MQIKHHEQLGHFAYCTNVHAGDAWPELIKSLRQHVPGIQNTVAAGEPFGLGLRIGAVAAEQLRDDSAIQALLDFLQQNNCYVFSINGFPYGPFHAQAVKENVYAPDWARVERLTYTNSLADTLVTLLRDADYGSISTVPGTFKPWAKGNTDAIAANLIQHVIYLHTLQQKTGKTITLALEPEPFCLLETIAETVDFFNDYLFCQQAVNTVCAATGLSTTDAHAVLRRHIGVCYDVCHAAVEYEDPVKSIEQLQSAGISIAKVQLSSALRIEQVGPDVASELAQFNEPVYLHQVIENRAGELKRYLDLPDALSQADAAQGNEWRIHFHVPIFIQQLTHFGTTQFFLREILALHRKRPITTHMEVETYTWDVLPDAYRNVEVGVAIAREMQWVIDELTT